MIALPSRKVLSGRILKDVTDKVSTKLLDNAKNDLSGVTLTFDGGTANEIIRITQQLFAENIKVNRLVTDSASENASAWCKQLQLLYHDKLFLPCFAHQMNLCVSNIFKESNYLTKVGEQAVAIASFFNRAKVWIGKL
ncbi:hypothetical protein RirG_120300 [Rhizophagus irregularis DAOM 197198w]|uniref:DUF659 domain-containing protein n=1 Tax=Rhizophagus irregularis (strain DAOM 197198w) TaxID=1432141 RepID=A0A015KH55_RHIIW|nr:hypothetical protein RirG_120300 [Rhizophagus irregularis DAOM 197198w]